MPKWGDCVWAWFAGECQLCTCALVVRGCEWAFVCVHVWVSLMVCWCYLGKSVATRGDFLFFFFHFSTWQTFKAAHTPTAGMRAHHASTARARESEREMESKIDLFEVQFHPLCFPLSCLYLQRWRGVKSLQSSLHVRRGQKWIFFFNPSFFIFAKLRDELHAKCTHTCTYTWRQWSGSGETGADSWFSMCVYDVFDVQCVTFFDALCILRVCAMMSTNTVVRFFPPRSPCRLSPAAGFPMSLTGRDYCFFHHRILPNTPFSFLVAWQVLLSICWIPEGEGGPGSQVIQTDILQSLASYFTLSSGFSF